MGERKYSGQGTLPATICKGCTSEGPPDGSAEQEEEATLWSAADGPDVDDGPKPLTGAGAAVCPAGEDGQKGSDQGAPVVMRMCSS